MDLNSYLQKLAASNREIKDLFTRGLPVKAGNLAVNHFKENFRKGGYQNVIFTPWKRTRRQDAGGKDAASQYGPLLSGRNHLMNTTHYVTEPGRVTILNDLKYAHIHNYGGTVTHTVTPKMRKFAWARYFKAAGINPGDSPDTKKKKQAAMNVNEKWWKGLALTKKTSITQTIPQRQFMGKGEEIKGKVLELAEMEVKRILNSK
jgi:hypothetical protein